MQIMDDREIGVWWCRMSTC